MLDYLFTSPILFLVWTIALLAAITIHEFAHAWMADQLGDPTARLAGRLSLNPFDHLDPIGTLALFIFRFGWGKPVPIDPFNLRNPRRDSAFISLAGPASNFLLAIVLAAVLRFLPIINLNLAIFNLFLSPIIIMNIMLGVFNLLPLNPLDGGKILIGFLPADLANQWEEILNQYSLIFLIFLLFPIFSSSSLISVLILPIVNLILSLLLPSNPLI